MQKLPLYNPLVNDFSVTYDINGDGVPETFTIPYKNIEYFAEPVYSHVKKHLATAVMNQRGVIGGNVEATLAGIVKEITDIEL